MAKNSNNKHYNVNGEPLYDQKDDMLCSWKEIADYVKRDVRTCYRWTKELSFPVQKYDTDQVRSRVWAKKTDIDVWLEKRKNNHHNGIKTKSRIPAVKIAVISCLVLIILSLSFIYFIARQADSNPEYISLAMLPFTEQDSNEYRDYFRLGITEEIAASLKQSGRFRVIPLFTVPDFNSWLERSNLNIADLGADFILNGKVKRSEDSIDVFVKLASSDYSTVVFEHEFSGDMKNFPALKNNIINRLAAELKIQMPLVAFAQSVTTSEDDAFDTYLKGMSILNSIKMGKNGPPINLFYQGNYYQGLGTKESNEFAIQLFTRAIEADEDLSQAYIGLAQCYMNYANYGWDYNIKWVEQALELLNSQVHQKEKYPGYFSSLTRLYLLKYLLFDRDTKHLVSETINRGILKYPHDPIINSLLSYWKFQQLENLGIRLIGKTP